LFEPLGEFGIFPLSKFKQSEEQWRSRVAFLWLLSLLATLAFRAIGKADVQTQAFVAKQRK
jgi:hypothetical protein